MVEQYNGVGAGNTSRELAGGMRLIQTQVKNVVQVTMRSAINEIMESVQQRVQTAGLQEGENPQQKQPK